VASGGDWPDDDQWQVLRSRNIVRRTAGAAARHPGWSRRARVRPADAGHLLSGARAGHGL